MFSSSTGESQGLSRPLRIHMHPLRVFIVHSCGELSVEDLSALKYNFQGDAAAAAAMKASALETSFGTYMRDHFAVLCCAPVGTQVLELQCLLRAAVAPAQFGKVNV
jgi:hypothetical protein